jgi:hypothetical protein
MELVRMDSSEDVVKMLENAIEMAKKENYVCVGIALAKRGDTTVIGCWPTGLQADTYYAAGRLMEYIMEQ